MVHNPADQAAAISSGSFHTDGMIVIPCSMKTLAGIRAGYAEGLTGRAADVVIKEGRKLDQFSLSYSKARRWQGLSGANNNRSTQED